MTALGLRNNNPLNIRRNSDVYEGELASENAFKRFSTLPYGYRAAFVTLGTYLARGKNTVEKIISTWSPPSENSTDKYIEFVEKESGVARNKVLTNKSGADYIKIVAAMSRMENGTPANLGDVLAGLRLQNKIS
jgi:hypothetical protein